MSRFLKRPAEPAPRPAATSIYEDRAATAPTKIVVSATNGRLIGIEVDRKFEPARPCCENPALCDRSECWTPIGELR